MNFAKRIFLSKFLWLMVGVVVLALTTKHWLEIEGGPREVVQRWGIWAPLASFSFQTITTMTPIGAVLIAIANGALFPLWVAIAINIASGVIGGIGMYFIWRRGDHEFDIESSMHALPKWFRLHQSDNLFFLTLLRLLPWAGGSLADLIAGSHKVPLRTQIASLFLGYFPGSVAYALIGAGIVKL